MRIPLSPYWLWIVLAIPAFFMTRDAVTSTDPRVFHILLHPSGEMSARLLIVTMMATPLAMLFRGWRGPRWLVKHRRYFGVASFGYAALHTLLYILDKGDLDRMTGEVERLYIWTGWLAFLVFIPLAATSMDFAVRNMGRHWKSLQRWIYAAAVLTLVHWAALHDWQGAAPALVHFAPLIALSLYRLWYLKFRVGRRRNPRQATAGQET